MKGVILVWEEKRVSIRQAVDWSVEFHCYIQTTHEEKTGIFVHTLVHQFTVRSVACNKLQCQEGSGSDERGNNIRECRDKIMNN